MIEHLGGEIARVDPDAGEDDRHVAWTRDFFAAMVPFLADGVYVNFLGREGDDRVRAAFGDNYDRLAALKHQHDSANVFRANQNVEPA